MTGPLEHYPVTPGDVDDVGQELNAAANPLYDVGYEAATGTRRADAELDRDLVGLLLPMYSDLLNKGTQLRTASAYAGGIMRTWAVAITTFNTGVDQLNKEYNDAKAYGFGVQEPPMRGGQTQEARETAWDKYGEDLAQADSAKLADVRRRRGLLLDELNKTGDDLAERLGRPPEEGDWIAFDKVGVLPQAFRDYLPPPGPRPEVPEGDKWYESLFKTLIFDYDQFGEGGSFWGGAIEIAGIIPVGKVLKGGKLVSEGVDAAKGAEKLSDAEKAIEAAKDAQKAYDKARDAEKAVESARKKLLQKFEGGGVPKGSDLKKYAEDQGWTLRQTEGGPPIYVDENGVKRMTIKKASDNPELGAASHQDRVTLKDASGQYIDRYGNPTTRKSPDSHIPIDNDL